MTHRIAIQKLAYKRSRDIKQRDAKELSIKKPHLFRVGFVLTSQQSEARN
ncbi:hypothetical protein [Calothrix sp. UHCC 0171]|nr:hypothetical protein [Calothrix sp. UHCC 0171]MEA5571606.1 hypothetical protein [Calothrix sp. UHCC 0171]